MKLLVFTEANLLVVEQNLESSLVIAEDIFQKIKKSGLTIFDISFPNLNVYFELGIACALDKKILMTFNPTLYYELHPNEKIPFDINQFRYLEYQNNEELENELVRKVEAIVKLEDFSKVDLVKIYKKVQKISRELKIDTEAEQIKEDREISDYEENVVCNVLDQFWNDRGLKEKDYEDVRYDELVAKVSEQFGRDYYYRLKDILSYLYLSNSYQPLIAHLDRAEFHSFRHDYDNKRKK